MNEDEATHLGEATVTYDIFFSYRTHRAAEAQPLIDALRASGLSVWQDTSGISRLDSIPDRVRTALARSRTLLSLHTTDYRESACCRWELIQAWCAASQVGDPYARVFACVPSGSGNDHALLERDTEPLSGQLWLDVPNATGAQALKTVVEHITTRLGAVDDHTFGELLDLTKSPGWWQHMRTGSPRFVGRERELWKLHGMLHRSQRAAITGKTGPDRAQVRGTGGLGKTLLSTEYALQFGVSYPGGVFWFDNGGDEPEQMLQPLAAHFDIEPAGPARTPEHVIADVKKSLNALPRYLWVVDNLPHGLREPDVARRAAPGSNGHTLFTTRSQQWAGAGECLDLGVLPPDAAFALLTGDCAPTNDAERHAAQEICEVLGFHALALDLLRALVAIQPSSGPYTRWLAELQSPMTDPMAPFAAVLESELPTNIQGSVTAVFWASLQHVDLPARRILFLCSHLADLPIPMDVLEAGMAELCPDDTNAFTMGLLDLKSHSLVTVDGGLLTMHALVRRAVWARWADEAEFGPSESMVLSALLARMARMGDVGDLQRQAAISAHVAQARVMADTLDSAVRAGIGGNVALHDHMKSDYERARVRQEAVVAAFQRLLGTENADTLTAMNNLASTMLALGDMSGARVLNEQIAKTRVRSQGPEHPDTLGTLHNLAIVMQAQGDVLGARDLKEHVLEARSRVLGREHADTLSSEAELAVTMSAQGDVSGARNLLDGVAETSVRVLGQEHPSTLTTLHNLANVFFALGDVTEARARFDTVLEARERVLGPEHSDTQATLQNLAVTMKMQGDLSGARRLFERIAETSTRRLGPEHPNSLTTLHNLARTLFSQGDLSGARVLQERVVEAQERVRGLEHPETLSSLQNLADTLMAQDDLQGALKLEERVLKARELALGRDHMDTLRTMYSLAEKYMARDNFSDAHALLKHIVEARDRALGIAHPQTIEARWNLYVTSLNLGDWSACESLLDGLAVAHQRRNPTEERIADYLDQMAERTRPQKSPALLRKLFGLVNALWKCIWGP